jgi:colanic acid/amylovoran biosynthesis protein
LAIGYGGNKAQGIMSDFNLDGFTVPIQDVTGDKLIQMFSTLTDEHEKIKKTLSDNNRVLLQKRNLLIQEISSVISK